jgi:lipopolysaccharide heptosyltransferase I
MEKILIIKISSLGDILHAFPAVSLIAAKYGNVQIDWLVNPAFAPILEYNKCVNRIIPFPRRELASPLTFTGAFINLIREIRREKYDLVIDLQGLLRSAFFAKFARAPVVAGFYSPKEKAATLFYNRRISPGAEHVHAVDKNVGFISKLLDIPFDVPDSPLPENRRNMDNLLGLLKKKNIPGNGPIIGIAPGARWESKQWPPLFFAKVLDTLEERIPGCRFLLLGSSDELETCRKISSSCEKAIPVTLAGETGIGELVEAIRISKCLLCNDSGPMHIAASMKIPVFAMFGPTDPDKTGPYGKEHSVFQPELSCIKCLKRYCPDKNYVCQKSVNPAFAAEGIIALLR